jgi:hypothetical protein
MCLTDNCNANKYKFNYCKHCYFKKRKECIEHKRCFICDDRLRALKKHNYLHLKCITEHINIGTPTDHWRYKNGTYRNPNRSLAIL